MRNVYIHLEVYTLIYNTVWNFSMIYALMLTKAAFIQ